MVKVSSSGHNQIKQSNIMVSQKQSKVPEIHSLKKKWGTYICIRINYKIPFLPFSLPKQSAFLYSSINESPANGNKTEWKSTHVYGQRFIFKAKQRNKSHSFQLFEHKSSIKCIFTVVIIILVGRYGWLSGNEKHTSAQH